MWIILQIALGILLAKVAEYGWRRLTRWATYRAGVQFAAAVIKVFESIKESAQAQVQARRAAPVDPNSVQLRDLGK